MTKRRVRLPAETEREYEEYLRTVRERLTGDRPLGAAVQETIAELHGDADLYQRHQSGETLPPPDALRLRNYHPDNVAVESEWYAEKDETAFERSKALQWLWRQFDKCSMSANVAFALRFRQLLAELLFADAGDNLRIFRNVTMSYGHNISVGDHTVIHDGVHLDDRGHLRIGNRVSLSEGAHLYSHDHDVVDQTSVTNYRTIIEDDVRITYDAMIRAGVRVGENAMVAAKSVVQGDVPAHHIVGGTPAATIAIKPGWRSVAHEPADTLEDRRAERTLDTPIPDDLEVFDEFERDLQPPDQ